MGHMGREMLGRNFLPPEKIFFFSAKNFQEFYRNGAGEIFDSYL
jgi:hypothetical protein